MVVGGGGVVVEIFAELKISYGGADAPRRFMARYRVCVVYLRARHYSKVLFDVFFLPSLSLWFRRSLCHYSFQWRSRVYVSGLYCDKLFAVLLLVFRCVLL